MGISSNYYVSPLSASNISNFPQDVITIANQEGGGTGLVYVAVSDNLEGKGIVGDPLKTKDNIQVVSVTATNNINAANNLSSSTVSTNRINSNSITSSYKGNGSQITDIDVDNITGFTTEVRSQISVGDNLGYSFGQITLNENVNITSITASLKGNGSQITNLSSSNLLNFTEDVRKQLSAGSNLNYNNGQFALNDNISLTSVTASYNGNGSLINNLTSSNITNFTNDVRAQHAAGANLTYTTGSYKLNDNINLTSVTSSFNGNGGQITNLTSSNITNFTNDVRNKTSGSQYVTYNTSSGVISLPYTGSIIGTTPIVLGQIADSLSGLSSVSSSLGLFTTLTASSFNLGNLTALTTSTGDLTVNNLTVNGVIENAAGAIQYITSSNYQIIPSTSLVKISAPSSSVILNTSFPTIKTTGYNEGTRIFIVNIGPNVITLKDDGAVPGTKLKMANQTYNQPVWGCIQFVLVSGSLGKVWIEAGRGA